MGNRLEIMKILFLKVFQERKKTAFSHRNFALEMKEQREQRDTSLASSNINERGSGDTSLIRFCLGTAAGLRSAVANVSPLECLQRS